MTTDHNMALVKEFYRHIEANDYDAAAALCHNDFVFYSQLDTPLNLQGFLAQEKGNMDGYPGFTFRVHEAFARDNKVACYMIFEGVHTAPMHDLAPTNRKIRFSLMMLITIKDGKIIEKRAHFDHADIHRQLQPS